MITHYVYKITFQNQPYVYYGSRSCNCLPEEDSDYLGSPITNKKYWVDFEPKKL